MTSLIVNADDLGSTEERDKGIFQAYEEGIVSSVSLLANGRSFLSAATYTRRNKLPAGVHLNLADGITLRGEINGLTGTNGELPGKQKLRECLMAGTYDQEAIRRELEAQIECVLDHGITPDHIDSHQHCHLFPGITTMVAELAAKYGIHGMRTSLPIEPENKDPEGQLGAELALYRQLAVTAHHTIHKAGLCTPDGLWGLPLLNKLNESNLCALLEDLPEGAWELMTHPGYSSNTGNSFDGEKRELELRALTSASARKIIERRKIKLCSFGDLSCAS